MYRKIDINILNISRLCQHDDVMHIFLLFLTCSSSSGPALTPVEGSQTCIVTDFTEVIADVGETD